ncbi:MAG TPA: thiamine-phosphate kinase, partial [Caldimonas sp.]|nr:thiamine-phosphate kinase [Caldimonas sp.]
LPRSSDVAALTPGWQRTCLLCGGDDYELVFTAPPGLAAAVADAGVASSTPVTRIGSIVEGRGLRFVDATGCEVKEPAASFDHFRESAEPPP